MGGSDDSSAGSSGASSSALTAAQIEHMLSQREHMLRNLPLGVYEIVDAAPDNPYLNYLSDRAAELWGVTRAQVEADSYAALNNLHPDDRKRVLDATERARTGRGMFLVEARFIVDGKQRWLRMESWPNVDAQQPSWLGYIQDVTEQYEARHRFRVLFEQSPLSIILHDAETGAVLDANPASWQAYGLDSLEELQRHSFWGEPPYSKDEAVSLIRAAAGGEVQRFEWYSVDARGNPTWELVTLMPAVISGEPRGFSIAADITAQRNAQQTLQRNEQLLTAMAELADVGGWTIDVESGALHWTEHTFRLHGLPIETDLSVTDALAFYVPEDRDRLEAALVRAREHGEPYALTLRMTTAEGEAKVLRSFCRPERYAGRVVRLSGAVQDVTQLVESERRFRAIFEESPAPILVFDTTSGKMLDANQQAWTSFGYATRAALLERQDAIWVGGEYSFERALDRLQHALDAEGARLEWPAAHADGHIIWYDVTLTPATLDGQACLLAVCLDITDRRAAEIKLRESEERFRFLLQDVDGVAVQGYAPDGRVFYWNRASEQLYGYRAEEALQGNLLELIIPPEMREGVRHNLSGVLEGRTIENGELELMRKDGSRVPVYSSHTVLRRPDEEPELFCIDIDLSERKAHEQALDHLANYDLLTGLPNRRLMGVLLAQMIARCARSEHGFALCYLDLDEFKPINDTHGHETGDHVLNTVAGRLRGLVRDSDLVARLGGDEFVLALEGIGDGPELERRLRFILDGLAQPLQVDHLRLQVSGSIGVTLYPRDQSDPDTLLRHADQAMYRAKAQGRNHFSVFDVDIEARVSEQRRRLSAIADGLEREEFQLYFQPKINLETGQLAGLEGLIRWQHPEEGLLSPLSFLPALDHSELESRFGEYVVRRALGQLEQWLRAGFKTTVSVNIAGPHLLSNTFVPALEDALAAHPTVPPRLLELEILESAAVSDLEKAIRVLQAVRGLGLQTSLDDFGTGYSSLSHLRSLPVDEVKIDQSFVRDMLTDLNDCNIVRGIISLAAAFDLRVVAEGVETEAHADMLRSLGCELAQGYAFARPMPAEDIRCWAEAWNGD